MNDHGKNPRSSSQGEVNADTEARLRELLANAAPRPWKHQYKNSDTGDGQWYEIIGADGADVLWWPYRQTLKTDWMHEATAMLIAEGVNELPAMLDALAASREREATLQERVSNLEDAMALAKNALEFRKKRIEVFTEEQRIAHEQIAALREREAKMREAIDAHRRNVWGDGPVGHPEDAELYAARAALGGGDA